MSLIRIFAVATLLLFLGCTEMRVKGEAKIFQGSSVSSTIQALVGIVFIGIGASALVGNFLPNRKMKAPSPEPNTPLSTVQRFFSIARVKGILKFIGVFVKAGLALFFGLILVSCRFSTPVSVYPDRVSIYAQSGKEIVIPFSDISAVELHDEPSVRAEKVRRLIFKKYDGSIIKQNAGINESAAIDTIQKALAAYQARKPLTQGSQINPSEQSH